LPLFNSRYADCRKGGGPLTLNGKDSAVERLDLQSRISELARIAGWIETLAARHSISDQTQFAMNLCLEEALSNIIRHGYSSQPDHFITVSFVRPREDYYVFDVEDEAKLFNPMDGPEPPAINAADDAPAGRQGIRLLRRFADSLEYHATPKGNRLTIGFSAAPSSITKY